MKSLDASQLIDAGRDVKTPFRLLVSRPGVGHVEILILSVLRLLPARRLVALAEVAGTKVVIKMFLGKKAGKYINRERTGVLALAQAGICTPGLLWEGEMENGRLLVFQYLPDGIDLDEQWSKSLHPGERLKILEMVMKVMSSLHDHGVVQNDIHLENFLLSDGKINTIDGDAVEQKSEAPLAEEASLKNLALIFAKGNATTSISLGFRPAYFRQNFAASNGILPFACLSRINRSSSAAATSFPPTYMAAEGSWVSAPDNPSTFRDK